MTKVEVHEFLWSLNYFWSTNDETPHLAKTVASARRHLTTFYKSKVLKHKKLTLIRRKRES